MNCPYGGTNPKIIYLFWIEKILKPQRHLLSVRHWLFFMMLGCFLGGCFFKITSMCSFVEAVLSSTFYQVLFKVFLWSFHMTLNEQNIFSSLILTLYFVAHWRNWLINGLVTTIWVVQVHASTGRSNSVRAGTEENPGLGVPALTWVTKRAKNVGEGA